MADIVNAVAGSVQAAAQPTPAQNASEQSSTPVKGVFDGADIGSVNIEGEGSTPETNVGNEVQQSNPDTTTEGQEKTAEQGSETKPIVVMGREFKTSEDLAKAYEYSSKESLRLVAKDKARQKELEEMQAKVIEMELNSNAPSFTEKTPEQIDQMEPDEKALYKLEKKQFEEKKAQFEANKKKMLAEMKAQKEAVQKNIMDFYSKMEADTENYPGVKEFQNVFDGLLRNIPWLSGKNESPEVLYYLAYGLKAYTKDMEAKKNAKKSVDAAKTTAQAQAAMSGTTSRVNGQPSQKDDDEEFNKSLVGAIQKKPF